MVSFISRNPKNYDRTQSKKGERMRYINPPFPPTPPPLQPSPSLPAPRPLPPPLPGRRNDDWSNPAHSSTREALKVCGCCVSPFLIAECKSNLLGTSLETGRPFPSNQCSTESWRAEPLLQSLALFDLVWKDFSCDSGDFLDEMRTFLGLRN